MTDLELLEMALEVRKHAYAPYSKFKVGAALLDTSGQVFTGCNVENASYGLSICAERVAISKAISEGSNRFSRLLIVGGQNIITPCGACRQVLAEFASDDLVLICANESGEMLQYDLEELFPQSFVLRRREV